MKPRRFILSIASLLLFASCMFAEGLDLHMSKEMLRHECLFGSRLISVNRASGKAFSEGQMKELPVLVEFIQEGDSVIVMKQRGYTDAKGTSWRTRISSEDLFRLRVKSVSENGMVVDAAPLLRTYPLVVSVITPKELKGDAVGCRMESSTEEEGIVEMTMDYLYADGLHARVMLFLMSLKDEPLRMKALDRNRLAYSSFEYRDADAKRSEKAQRWDLTDGKKIRFYVDKAFPDAWYPYIKEGIEDWNKAFKAIGIDAPIEVYPEPEGFDRNRAMVNMVRFIPGTEANAKGQVYADPRSGEILQADILWWEGVTGLMKDWRYIQTGASDPRARAEDYPIEILGPMIRHAVCHEMGHVLGLGHNMGASFAYKPRQLHDKRFTQDHGTSASVMDYARYNHLATSGDVRRGVNLLPPRIGPYDMYAIAEGYSGDEVEGGRYSFFSPFISAAISPDPSSQAESLSDDLLYSSARGLQNCRRLLRLDGLTPERMELIKKNYYKYISLALSNIGGSVHGKPVPIPLQKKTVRFVLRSLEEVPQEIRDFEQEKHILDELGGNFLPKRIADSHGERERDKYMQRLKRNHYKSHYHEHQ